MSSAIEQKGGFFAYIWNNLTASVASRTVGTMNDGDITTNDVIAIFANP